MNTLTILLGIMGLGGPELIVIGIIVLLLFGGKKIPQLMKGIGQGISEFKKGTKGIEDTEVIKSPNVASNK